MQTNKTNDEKISSFVRGNKDACALCYVISLNMYEMLWFQRIIELTVAVIKYIPKKLMI